MGLFEPGKALLPTFVAANLKRVPDTPVDDTDICALTVNVLNLKNQLNELMGRMAAFIDLKNQVVELKYEVKANKSVFERIKIRICLCQVGSLLHCDSTNVDEVGDVVVRSTNGRLQRYYN